MQPSDEVLPIRAWEELVATSRRRGKALRRRRQAAVGAPVLALSLAVLALPIQGMLHDPRTESLVTDVAHQPGPAATAEPAPAPLSSQGPDHRAAVAPADAGSTLRHAARRHSSRYTGPAPAPVVPPTVPPTAAFGPTSVSFSDARGDADTRDGGLGAGTVSDASRDIVSMRFARERDGIRVTMDLAGDAAFDGLYYAYMTDRGSHCEVHVYLGMPDDDGFYVYCGDETSDYIRVPPTADRSPRQLEAFVPYRMLPPGVDLRNTLADFAGVAWTQHANQPEVRVDRADTNEKLGAAR